MLQTLKKLRNRVLLVYNVYDVSRGFVARALHFRGGGAMLSIYIIGYETGCPPPPPLSKPWGGLKGKRGKTGREEREEREEREQGEEMEEMEEEEEEEEGEERTEREKQGQKVL